MIPLKDINPTRRTPLVTIGLLIANILVFLYQVSLGPRQAAFVTAFALVPERLFHPETAVLGPIPAAATIFTSMFLHGGFMHIAGNMLYLWIFGNNVEDSMGRFRFLVFYLLTGAIAAIGHGLTDTASAVPMIGASGAVSGVLGAYFLLFPRAGVIALVILGFFVRTVEVPAVIVLGFWFVLQFLNALVSGASGGGVAWFAHIGGFIAGALLIGLFKRPGVPFGGGRRYRTL